MVEEAGGMALGKMNVVTDLLPCTIYSLNPACIYLVCLDPLDQLRVLLSESPSCPSLPHIKTMNEPESTRLLFLVPCAVPELLPV